MANEITVQGNVAQTPFSDDNRTLENPSKNLRDKILGDIVSYIDQNKLLISEQLTTFTDV